MAVFVYSLHLDMTLVKKVVFLRLFLATNISGSTYRMKMVKVCKVFKIFLKFPKILKKGLLAPKTSPSPQIQLLKKIEIFLFFLKNFICGFRGVLGAQRHFFQNFRKHQKFLNTLHAFTVFIR